MRRTSGARSILGAFLLAAAASSAAAPPPKKPAGEVHAPPVHPGEDRGGDLDAMRMRRRIRVLVVYNRTNYFIDKGVQRGITYEAFHLFEEYLNKKYRTGNLKIQVNLRPVSRKDLAKDLLDGVGDIAAAALTVTPEREKLVDFTVPVATNISEIAVGGPGSAPLATADDLSGKEVLVRKGSIYEESVQKLNLDLAKRGKKTVKIRQAPADLEDEDLLEMVNAGLVPYVVVDDFMARFWTNVFPGLRLNPGAKVRTGGEFAWAIRKNSPLLKAELDAFIRKYPPGSATYNILLQRYLKSTKYVKNAASDAARKRFREIVALFKKYGDKYNIDFVLMAAQGYQESQLNQSVKSRVGAVGVMQVMPATGRELNVGDITKLEPNIHAGVKYMRFMIDQYFANEPMDRLNKTLFAFAAYNAGPARIQSLRREAANDGFDPNVWFQNVEVVASKKLGRETVNYVSNIYKYYVAYTLYLEELEERKKAKESVSGS
jgi:membrane-bound lytic murein transglycosylase MltF